MGRIGGHVFPPGAGIGSARFLHEPKRKGKAGGQIQIGSYWKSGLPIRKLYVPEISGRAQEGWCKFPKWNEFEMRRGWKTFEGNFENLMGRIGCHVFPSGAGMGSAKFLHKPKRKCKAGGKIPSGDYWKSILLIRLSYFPENSGKAREGWCRFPK